MTRLRMTVCICLGLISGPQLFAQRAKDLADFSLEELSAVRVTSVSRRQEQLLRTASSVYVITPEDIRRSGATDLADVLRMVPGVNVAQISSSKFAVSARGFNAQWENKLLVMVDGRSVYAPSFSGVFWDLQDFVMEDIERIEVIRGPGATMWGSNAVNGVISITTRRAADTSGTLLTVNAGTRRPGDVALRHGGSFGTDTSYRVFAKQTTRLALPEATTGNRNDSWNLTHGGFRLDWKTSPKDSFTIDGDFLRAVSGARVNGVVSLEPIRFRVAEHSGQRAANLRARWSHSANDNSTLTLQVYYENIANYETFATIEHLFDFDLQHSLNAGTRQKLTWGAGLRLATDRNINSPHMGYSPATTKSGLYNAFLQDEIALVPNRFYLTAGAKIERNAYTGVEFQPTIRAVWTPDSKRSIWASASRAVRTANRSDRGFRTDITAFPDGENAVGVLALIGDPQTRSETLIAYELGHRYQANRKLSLDIATFYNNYDHLTTTEEGNPFFEEEPGPPHMVYPIHSSNLMKGETYGGETALNFQVTPSLSLKGGYSLLRMQLHPYATSSDSYAESPEGNSPRHQVFIGSSFSIPHGFQLAANAYVVSGLPGVGVRGYTRLDLNLSKRIGENLELKLAGQNLLNPSRPEFGENEGTAASAMKRTVFGRIALHF